MWWENQIAKAKFRFAFFSKLPSLVTSGTEMVQKRYKCDSKPMLTETVPEQGLYLHDLRKMEESKLLHFFHFSGCHSKMSNPSISQKNFQTDESKCTYIPMRMKKTIDNIAQVVRMNFNKNSTPKFNLHIKKNVFILLNTWQRSQNTQSLFVAKVGFLHSHIKLISDLPCFAFQDQEYSFSPPALL